MYILVHYTDTQSNYSLIVQDYDFSKNLSFSMVSPVQMKGGKVMKKAMFATSIIYDWGKNRQSTKTNLHMPTDDCIKSRFTTKMYKLHHTYRN